MLAIHNTYLTIFSYNQAANAFATLSKCQQFTTGAFECPNLQALQTLLQSYQNVSNSQPSTCIPLLTKRCKRFCKVIKMLAIHNNMAKDIIFRAVANAFAKLSKCQQFTTVKDSKHFYRLLQTLLQSYQNVSNSQQNSMSVFFVLSCKRFCKVIKMLAIHNGFGIEKITYDVANAFAKLSKCQQFTTSAVQKQFCTPLQTLLQSYQNVSNSQLM